MNILVYILAFLKYTIYGLSIIFTGVLSENVDALDILSLRFIMSAGVLSLLKVTRAAKIDVGLRDLFGKTERASMVKPLLLSALFEPVLYMFFETLGISMTTGITAGVILSLLPVASCISEAVFLKEKTTGAQKIFLALGIIGVAYIAVNTSSSDGKNSVLGILFLIVTVFMGALYMTFSRKSSKAFSAMEITYVSSWLGMICFNSVNIVRHLIRGDILNYFKPYFNIGNMIGFIFLAVISTVIGTAMNNYALSKMQVSTMSAFNGVSTLVTILVSAIVIGERIHYFHIIGMVLIVTRMIGVSYIQIKRDKNKTSSAVTEAENNENGETKNEIS